MTAHQVHLSHPKYRPDIDGLRAVAVLAVVAFHAFPSWMKGGFIGVDIFFVISGYLISTIIFENLDKGTFSFTEFYARRIKRIFPTLTLVLISCFAFGWLTLLADEFKQLGKHIAGGAAFVSNFVLWNESGYFDNTADTKPLLHLWSLGIEEQFYIVWPLLLWFAHKKRFNLLSIGVLVALVSFYLNIHQVKIDVVAGFYSPQTRFWELMLGSILAWLTLYKPNLLANTSSRITKFSAKIIFGNHQEGDGKTLASLISVFAFLLVIYGFCRINKDLSFPGKWALIPVLGTALLIFAGPKAWVNRTILSNKIAVWFGLISFPLYLWHWPLLSFSKIVAGEVGKVSSRNIHIATIVFSILLSWLTYKLIERPIRLGKHGKVKVTALVVLMSVIGFVGYNTYSLDGLPFRRIDRVNKVNSPQLDWHSEHSAGCENKLGTNAMFCLELGNQDNVTIAVIGDSTANSISPGLFEQFYSFKGEGLVNFGAGTCPPIRGLTPNGSWGLPTSPLAPNCQHVMERAYDYILKNKKIKTVVLVIFARDLQNWGIEKIPQSDYKERFKVVRHLLDKDINELLSADKKVIVSYDLPLYPIDAHSCLKRLSDIGNRCVVDVNNLKDRQPYLNLFNAYFKDKVGVCSVQASVALIQGSRASLFDSNGVLMIRDNHHLSYNGSNLVAREFKGQGCLDVQNTKEKKL